MLTNQSIQEGLAQITDVLKLGKPNARFTRHDLLPAGWSVEDIRSNRARAIKATSPEGQAFIGFRWDARGLNMWRRTWFPFAEFVFEFLHGWEYRTTQAVAIKHETIAFDLRDPRHVSLKLFHDMLTTSEPTYIEPDPVNPFDSEAQP